MTGLEALSLATLIGLGLLLAGIAMALLRLLRGPTVPDRILALDLLTTLGLCFIAVFTLRTGLMLYLDIAIALGLVGFLSTVALARYVLKKGAMTADTAVVESTSVIETSVTIPTSTPARRVRKKP